MSLKYANKDLSSKPPVDTSIRVNQTKWLATGEEKYRSHSSFTADELADLGAVVSGGGAAAAAVEWQGIAGTSEEGNRYAQVLLNFDGTPEGIWFRLPGETPVLSPEYAEIERVCCEPQGHHGPEYEPNHE